MEQGTSLSKHICFVDKAYMFCNQNSLVLFSKDTTFQFMLLKGRRFLRLVSETSNVNTFGGGG